MINSYNNQHKYKGIINRPPFLKKVYKYRSGQVMQIKLLVVVVVVVVVGETKRTETRQTIIFLLAVIMFYSPIQCLTQAFYSFHF